MTLRKDADATPTRPSDKSARHSSAAVGTAQSIPIIHPDTSSRASPIFTMASSQAPVPDPALLIQMLDVLIQPAISGTADGLCDSCNQAWLDYTGLTREQATSQDWLQHIHPNDLELAGLSASTNYNQPGSCSNRVRLRRGDGYYRWFDIRTSVLHDAGGQPLRWILSALDAGMGDMDGHQSTGPFKGLLSMPLHTLLASIVENSDDAIVAKTLDGTVRSWNRAAEQMFGYSAEEMIGRPLLTIFPRDRLGEELQLISRILRGEKVDHFETQRLRKDGSLIDVSVTISPIRNAAGQIIGASKVARDITQRKRAEEEIQALNAHLEQQVVERTRALERARHDLQQILDAIPLLIGYWDRKLVNRFANHAYLDWLGIDPKDVVGRTMEQVLGSELVSAQRQHIEAALRGENTSFERTIPIPAGEGVRRVLVQYVPDRHAQRETAGFYAMVIDLSLIKQKEAELRAANRDLEAFSYAVAHDLRAPLRAMGGFSQALREDYGHLLDTEGLGYLERINSASVSMATLIDGLLQLSRSTTGVLNRADVDVTSLCQNLRHEHEISEPERTILWDIAPDMHISGDPRMVQTVIRNLLENACKYTSRREQAQIRVYQQQEQNTLWLCVEDNGAGFSMEHAQQLFKPFQRLHRQDEFAGTGIGLATVQRILARHGGRIEAWGEPGQGARFRVCFGAGSAT